MRFERYLFEDFNVKYYTLPYGTFRKINPGKKESEEVGKANPP